MNLYMIAFNVFKGKKIESIVIEKIDILIDDLYKEICDEYILSNNFDIKKILINHNCEIIKPENNQEIELVFFIIVNDNNIKVNVYQVPNVLLYSKIYYKKIKIDGNHIDQFIINELYGELNAIDNYIDDIKSRKYERKDLIEYSKTTCYENDLRSLCNIKNSLEILLNNCNKEIETYN